MEFSMQNSGVGSHAFIQGIFLTPIKPVFLTSPALAGQFFTTSATWEAQIPCVSQHFYKWVQALL